MKKNIIQFTTAASLVVLMFSTGCNKVSDFGDTNLNPNGVAEPITSALLTNAELTIPTITTFQQPPAFFCQYLAESTYPNVSKYAGLNLNSSGNYSGAMQDLQVIINKNTDPAFQAKALPYGDNESQTAIAMIQKAYIMWTTTDRWGDLPYSEALKGAQNLLPKYDKQQDIYTKLLQELTAATTMFKSPVVFPIKGDIIYGGDIAKWRKFANTLRMMVAMRMSKRYPAAGAFAATEFSAALNSPYGYITANADNYALKYSGGSFLSPAGALHVSQDIAVAKTFTDALNNLSDPRVNSMSSLPNGAPYGLCGAAPIGTPYGRLFGTGNGGVNFYADNATVVMISASSSLLTVAEGYERVWAAGNAELTYNAAVTASFDQWAQTMPANYLTTGAANYLTGAGAGAIGGVSVTGSTGATPNKLSRIALQAWISFFPDGIQGWSNWRRTGVPDLKPTTCASNTTTGGQIPRRLTYGPTDFSTNPDQVAIAITNMGGDTQDTRVWWDQ